MSSARSLEDWLVYTEKQGSCLLWTRALNTDGYPRAGVTGNTNLKVHRVVYQLKHPEEDITGKIIRHSCDNPVCINPEHLLSGTPADNMRDRDSRERHGKAKLSIQDVREIRDLSACLKHVDIAQLYGVNHRTISSVVSRTHFKHVD